MVFEGCTWCQTWAKRTVRSFGSRSLTHMRSVAVARNHGAKFDVALVGSDQAESMLIRFWIWRALLCSGVFTTPLSQKTSENQKTGCKSCVAFHSHGQPDLYLLSVLPVAWAGLCWSDASTIRNGMPRATPGNSVALRARLVLSCCPFGHTQGVYQ